MLDFHENSGAAANRTMTRPLAKGESAEVVVVGAGAVGLTLGLALTEAGLSVLLVGKIETRPQGRTVALLDGSLEFLARLGVWAQLAEKAAPLRVMRLVDDTGSLFAGPPVDFHAHELGLEAFGRNIENVDLVAGLAVAARRRPGLRLVEDHIAEFETRRDAVHFRCAGGDWFETPLLLAADGRGSPARKAAGIPARVWRHPQAALTTILRHEQPHRAVSTEFHTRSGPFTLVPLPPRAGAEHRSSLVWMMAPEALRRRLALDEARLAGEIEAQSHRLLGGVAIEGPIGHFPIGGLEVARMVGRRVALLGEAAHAFPPIGAQGLNLGLRDVAALTRLLAAARLRGEDLGSAMVLDRYARERRGDVALRTLAVEGLNRALLTDLLPVDALRGFGLLALANVGPLRRWVMRQGLTPAGRPG